MGKRSTKTSRSKTKKDRMAVGIILSLVTVFGAIFFVQYSLERAGQFDEDTLCLLKQTTKHIIVVVDKSDQWDPDDVERVGSLITRIYRSVPARARLTVSAIIGAGPGSTLVKKVFDKCNPGSERECNALYQNCRRIRNRYAESFSSQLDDVISTLEQPGKSSFSPIFETVVQMIDDSEGQDLEIHLISDLMENGSKFRFYDVVPLAEEIEQEYPINFDGRISFYAHIVERRRHSIGLRFAVQSVWGEYLEGQGARVEFRRLLITE